MLVSILSFAIIVLVTIVMAGKSSGQQAATVRHVVVAVNKSCIIHLDRQFATVTLGSPDIADVKPITNSDIYIQAKKLGTTNITVFDHAMHLVEIFDLEVTIDAETLQRKIQNLAHTNSIRVSASNGDVILSGMAANAVQVDRAVSVAKSLVKAENIINAIDVAPSQEVQLKVRFLEASRNAERDLGVNWFGTNANGTRGVSTGLGSPLVIPGDANTGGVSLIKSAGTLLSTASGEPFGVVLANLVNDGTNIDLLISALERKGSVRTLAEPNLVALSGDTARFLAGGEFPVPVAVATTNGAGVTPTIQFKKFGVSLAFVPTVLRRGLINLRIAPEVSQLDYSNAVSISGTTIPSLVTRNAQTTIELRDGQSFAIAGLLQSNSQRQISQLPWVGSVPVLGSLFRSTTFQKNESDLVIIVTPHLVRPATPAEHLATPLDKRLPANDIDLFLYGKMELPKRYFDYVASGGNVQGPYGYIIAVNKAPSRPASLGDAAK
jgi:pilus assembly protein CpaC